MKRALILSSLVLALAACSDKPVGQSEYFDPWENPQFRGQPQTQPSPDVLALNRQIEQKRLERAAQAAAQSGDQALVASLEAAIATAGNDRRIAELNAPASAMPAQLTTALPVQSQPVQNGVQTLAPVIAEAQQNQNQPVAIAGTNQISDNSFSTVVQNQTIETDAARLAALQQSNVILQAEPLPRRTDGINLAAFARSTTHNIGQRLFPRKSRSSASQRCRKYGNPDAAQRAFLSSGGPESDDLRLDPDGDGFVCGWSPIPFRNLKVGG